MIPNTSEEESSTSITISKTLLFDNRMIEHDYIRYTLLVQICNNQLLKLACCIFVFNCPDRVMEMEEETVFVVLMWVDYNRVTGNK